MGTKQGAQGTNSAVVPSIINLHPHICSTLFFYIALKPAQLQRGDQTSGTSCTQKNLFEARMHLDNQLQMENLKYAKELILTCRANCSFFTLLNHPLQQNYSFEKSLHCVLQFSSVFKPLRTTSRLNKRSITFAFDAIHIANHPSNANCNCQY